MERLQMILKAKNYLELMARSIDPVTQEPVEDPTLQKQEIKDVLLYVVSLLDELAVNGEEAINEVAPIAPVTIVAPVEFSVDKINKNLIAVSYQPIRISGFVKRINNQTGNSNMKNFKPSWLTDWLLKNGYLNKEIRPVVKNETVYSVTPSSKDIGIVEQNKIDPETGEIKKTVVLTKSAQEFIVDNLENIVESTDSLRSHRDVYRQSEISENKHSEASGEKILDSADEKNYKTIGKNIPEMVGKKWTDEEQNDLIREFTEEKLSIKHIAQIHRRKTGGIRSRLVKLGLIEK